MLNGIQFIGIEVVSQIFIRIQCCRWKYITRQLAVTLFIFFFLLKPNKRRHKYFSIENCFFFIKVLNLKTKYIIHNVRWLQFISCIFNGIEKIYWFESIELIIIVIKIMLGGPIQYIHYIHYIPFGILFDRSNNNCFLMLKRNFKLCIIFFALTL